jgi:hypothetical protein
MHEGRIITIDQLSFSHPNPSSGASTVLMIDNLQPGTINLGARFFWSLMGTFDYLPPSNDVRFISAIPDQPKAAIFQVLSFKMGYFYDLWTLPSPVALIERVGNLGMEMPLSAAKVAYTVVQQASDNLDPSPAQELDPFLEPIWAQESFNA